MYLPLSTLASASSLQMNCRAAMVTTHSPLHAIFLHISLHSLLLALTIWSQIRNKIWHMLESLRMWTVDWACAWHNETSVPKICNQACTLTSSVHSQTQISFSQTSPVPDKRKIGCTVVVHRIGRPVSWWWKRAPELHTFNPCISHPINFY